LNRLQELTGPHRLECGLPELAWGLALTGAGCQGAGGHRAEQGGRANVERVMARRMRLLSGGLGKPWCRFNHGLLFLPGSPGIE